MRAATTKPDMATTGRMICLAATVLLAGCSTTADEGMYKFSEGWRKARVERVLTAEELRKPRAWECTRHTTADQRRGHIYAILSYRQPPNTRRHLVSVTADDDLRAGEKVYLNLSTCENAIVRRIKPHDATAS